MKIVFRGLFALVRHVANAEEARRSPAERMTILFPGSDSRMRGGEGHDHHGVDEHVPRLFIETEDGQTPPREVQAWRLPLGDKRMLPVRTAEDNFDAFQIPRVELRLPFSDRAEAVGHEEDEPVPSREPECCHEVLGSSNLSRLGDLNTLTGAPVDPRNFGVRPPYLKLRVVLSGGRIRCLPSPKPLGDAFFEFYDERGSQRIQQMAEDVEFEFETKEPTFTIGVKDLDDEKGKIIQIPIPTTKRPVYITSFPKLEKKRCRDLQSGLEHFQLYYPLMAELRQEPLLRYAAGCDQGRLVHTMPPIPPDVHRRAGRLTTDCHQSCHCAQAFHKG